MKIRTINHQTGKSIRQKYFSLLRVFLRDLSCDYPFFEEWLEHSFSSVSKGERTIVVCEAIDQIAGVAILKDTKAEKKICTIRVAQKFRRQGIGTMLLIKSREVLMDKFPLITVSDDHINEFRHFLSRFGFMEKNTVKSVYRYGHDEYYFNKPYKHQTVLMSIKPRYARKIEEGEKTVEFRKICFTDNVNRVYVYSSTPEQRIIGYFEIDKIVKASPEVLWEQFSKRGFIDENKYFKYYENSQVGYAICIRRFVKLRQEVVLNDIFDATNKVRAPQNYCYIDNVVVLQRLRLLE